jgi:hypothetical protein
MEIFLNQIDEDKYMPLLFSVLTNHGDVSSGRFERMHLPTALIYIFEHRVAVYLYSVNSVSTFSIIGVGLRLPFLGMGIR